MSTLSAYVNSGYYYIQQHIRAGLFKDIQMVGEGSATNVRTEFVTCDNAFLDKLSYDLHEKSL